MKKNKIALAVHGGAGTIERASMTAELEREYREGITNALEAGWKILEKNGSALDAVEASVIELENFPLFNAGRGSVFTHEGKNEMDASLMDGRTLRAGAVAFVKNVVNPIKLARLVMTRTEHILLAGDGADQFAREMNVELADDAYFFTDFRYEQLLKAREEGIIQLDHAAGEAGLIEDDEHALDVSSPAAEMNRNFGDPKTKTGTVGAVACDREGNLAAATSTGGMTNKKFGRIGDTPLIGAGTYADNRSCAVSCTGHGEYFMIASTAFDVSARMKYKGQDLFSAARDAVAYLTEIGGEGGLIAVDAQGNIALEFNCEGMYRGFITVSGEPVVEIYR